jgi:ligand-binding sensor domain-containing protein
MNKPSSGCWILFAFLAALSFFPPGNAVGQDLNDMRFELLDEEDGLSNHWLYGMVQDSQGFVWIGTNLGLNRYDGYNFKVYRHDPNDSTSLLDDQVQVPFVDRSGRLWVGNVGGMISLFHPGRQNFRHYSVPGLFKPERPGSGANILYHDDNGALWISGKGLGLNIFDPVSGNSRHFDLPGIFPGYPEADSINYNSVYQVYKAPDGIFWLATANGLYTFIPSSGQFTYFRYTPVSARLSRLDFFNKILPDGERGLWLSAWGGGVIYFDIASQKFSAYRFHAYDFNTSIGNIIYDLENKNEEELWVATGDRGLCVFNKKTGKFRFRKALSLADAENFPFLAANLLITRDGVMFVISNDGVLKHNPHSHLFHFRQLPISESQNGEEFAISQVIEDPGAHAIYFATQLGNGLNVMDTRTGELRAFPVEVDPSGVDAYMMVTDMLHDDEGRLWVLSSDYMYEYDKAGERLIKIPDPFSKKEYQARPAFGNIYADPEGNIWVTTRQGGLHRFDAARRKLSDVLNIGHPQAPETVEFIAWDGHGRMWVMGKGVVCTYDPDTEEYLRHFSGDLQIQPGDRVRGMGADRSGNIWIALDGKGLVKINTQNEESSDFSLVTPAEGLPSARIFNFGTDPEGMIWLATILGAIYMDPDSLSFRIFNQALGMDKNTIYMRFEGSKRGPFYITTPGRYCRVDLGAVGHRAALPKVFLDKFSVFNKEKMGVLGQNTSITVSPGENFFSFEFGCTDFTNQALNKFAYKLEGWDKDWVQSGSRRYASYTNLDGGSYVFKVKAANSEGVWGEPISVPVFIKTPFYKRPWFASLAALVFAAMIYGLYIYRVRQIEETERLKTEFNRQLSETRLAALRAQMNPHFIFNCLNSINRYIIKSDIKTSSLYLTRFAKLIRLILDNSEHKKVVLSNEIEALRLYIDMESLRFDHKFTFDVSIAPEVDAGNIEVPPLIIQPYVENAIWHGLLHKDAGGHLSVQVMCENGSLVCEITDNGIGREKAMEYKSKSAQTRKSVGMKLTEERLKIAGGDFSNAGSQKIIDLFDENGEACGTKVILTLPV